MVYRVTQEVEQKTDDFCQKETAVLRRLATTTQSVVFWNHIQENTLIALVCYLPNENTLQLAMKEDFQLQTKDKVKIRLLSTYVYVYKTN